MRELSLFSGAGGGLLASKYLLGWRTIGYVEFDDYCQRVLAQRIRDGLLDEAPIFGDIRSFIREGYAGAYQGMVDVVSAGFPCQPFSVAGKRKGRDDDRNMWPATFATIRIIRPRYVFLENVPGLLSAGQTLILIALQKVRQFDLFGARNPNSFTGRFIRDIIKVVGPRYFGRVLGDLASIGYDAEWTVLGADDVGAPHRRKRLWILAYSSRE